MALEVSGSNCKPEKKNEVFQYITNPTIVRLTLRKLDI